MLIERLTKRRVGKRQEGIAGAMTEDIRLKAVARLRHASPPSRKSKHDEQRARPHDSDAASVPLSNTL